MMRAAVAIAYSVSSMVHLIALALWLGGIVFFLIVLGPAVHELEPKLAIKTLNQGESASKPFPGSPSRFYC